MRAMDEKTGLFASEQIKRGDLWMQISPFVYAQRK
jgi:hypothetical protein